MDLNNKYCSADGLFRDDSRLQTNNAMQDIYYYDYDDHQNPVKHLIQ